MDVETHRKIVDLRKRIRALLDREDSRLSSNVGIQFVWRKRDNPYRATGKICGGFVTARVREPDGVKFINVRRPKNLLQFDQYLRHEKGWVNWGSLLASFELPIMGFDENRFCDVSVIEVDLQGRRPVFSNDKAKGTFAAPIDDTLPKEFDEIFTEVADVHFPLGRFGCTLKERLLSRLAERVQEGGTWDVEAEENAEDGKARTLSHVACIMAYRAFENLLGEMLNESRFGEFKATKQGEAEQVAGKIAETPRGQRRVNRKRRRTGLAKTKPLTLKQIEAIKLHGDCEGNIAAVARRMGIDRSTADQHIKEAFKKLGTSAPTKAKTIPLKTDRRGQSDVAASDEHRG